MVQTAQIGRKQARAPLRVSRPVYVLLMAALSVLLWQQLARAVYREQHQRVVFVGADGRRE